MVGTTRTRTGIIWRFSAIMCTVAMSTCCTLLVVLPNDARYTVSVVSLISCNSAAKCSVMNDFCTPSSNRILASACTWLADVTVAIAVFSKTSLSGRFVFECNTAVSDVVVSLLLVLEDWFPAWLLQIVVWSFRLHFRHLLLELHFATGCLAKKLKHKCFSFYHFQPRIRVCVNSAVA